MYKAVWYPKYNMLIAKGVYFLHKDELYANGKVYIEKLFIYSINTNYKEVRKKTCIYYLQRTNYMQKKDFT